LNLTSLNLNLFHPIGSNRMRLSSPYRFYIIAVAALCTPIAISLWWERKVFPILVAIAGDDIRQFLARILFYVGGQPVRIWFLFKTALFLIFLHLFSRAVSGGAQYVLKGNPHVDKQRSYLISKVMSVLVYIVGILIGIHAERINLSTLAFVGGTLGVGIGLGLQSLASNVVSGIILLIEQPIRLGDRIEFGEKTGKVVRVGGRSSWIRTYDNKVVIVPNAELTSKQIINWTATDPKVRIPIPVSVAYGTDTHVVISALASVAGGHRTVMKDPAPDVILSELGPYSMNFVLRVWTLEKANDISKLQSELLLQIIQRFRELAIEIPVPQVGMSITVNSRQLAIHNAERGAQVNKVAR
jgi:small-conductance mechanosensitive channel